MRIETFQERKHAYYLECNITQPDAVFMAAEIADLRAALASQASKGAGVQLTVAIKHVKDATRVLSSIFIGSKPDAFGRGNAFLVGELVKAVEYLEKAAAPPPAQAQPVAVNEVMRDALMNIRDYRTDVTADVAAPAMRLYAQWGLEGVAQPVADAAPCQPAPVDEADLECQIPPFGWRCTRGAGHSGPCAAVECPEDVAAVEYGLKRLAAQPSPAQGDALSQQAVSVEALKQALKSAQTGHGSYGPNYDGHKLAAAIRALAAKPAQKETPP